MTDQELLERAARAVGAHDLTQWSDKITDHDSPHYGGPALHPSGFGQQAASWNPLTDDADAFRLMVALGITVEFTACGRVVATKGDAVGVSSSREARGENTRRAIVRAAAEMVDNQSQEGEAQ